jgi:hypothetical protein
VVQKSHEIHSKETSQGETCEIWSARHGRESAEIGCWRETPTRADAPRAPAVMNFWLFPVAPSLSFVFTRLQGIDDIAGSCKMEPFPPLNPPKGALDTQGPPVTMTKPRPRRKSSSLGGEPRGDTGASALATLSLLPQVRLYHIPSRRRPLD